MENVAKLFKCNAEVTEVTEWCIARNKKEAYTFLDKFWDDGAIMKKLYVNVYLKKNPGKTLDDFIDYFFIEEDSEKEFTVPDAGKNNESVTQTVQAWIDDAREIPSYLCHEAW